MGLTSSASSPAPRCGLAETPGEASGRSVPGLVSPSSYGAESGNDLLPPPPLQSLPTEEHVCKVRGRNLHYRANYNSRTITDSLGMSL